MSFQFSEVSNCVVIQVRQRGDVVGPLEVADQIAEGAALAAQHAGDPGRLGREIDQLRQRPFRRHRHAVLDVRMALPDHLQVDGQHQRAAFGRDRALDQRLDEAAVLHHVELEPERLVDGGGDVLDRADRHRAQGEGNAGGLRGAAGVNFAVAVLHADQPDRRQDQRHRRGLAEDRGGEIALRDVDQDALAELDRLQVVDIGAQRVLGIGAAIGIVEEGLGHAALVQLAQIFDAGDVFHGRSRPFLYSVSVLSSSMVGSASQIASRGATHAGRTCHDRTAQSFQHRRRPRIAPKSAGWTRPWRRGWRRPFRAPTRSMSPSRRPRRATITSSGGTSGSTGRWRFLNNIK